MLNLHSNIGYFNLKTFITIYEEMLFIINVFTCCIFSLFSWYISISV